MFRSCQFCILTALAVLPACGSTSSGGQASVGGSAPVTAGGNGGAAPQSGTGGDIVIAEAGRQEPQSCASVSEHAMSGRAVDVIFVIDNSGSMSEEIGAVEARINKDFAAILDASGADYRVIMVSEHGAHRMLPDGSVDSDAICVGPPLGASTCDVPGSPLKQNPPRFYQYNSSISSQDAWCKLIDGWKSADADSSGWSSYVRPGAFTDIVVISDDEISCVAGASEASMLTPEEIIALPGAFVYKDPAANADRFDRVFRALEPEHFGTAEQRNYRVHSIVGVSGGGDDGKAALTADAPLEMRMCDSSSPGHAATVENAGLSHQAISILTGGLRYPICHHESFDVIFHAIADDAIHAARLACEWKIPPPPGGMTLDPNQVNLEYRAGGVADPLTIPKAASAAACGDAGGWYYDSDSPGEPSERNVTDVKPTKIKACPATCSTLEADATGEVSVAFGCATKVF